MTSRPRIVDWVGRKATYSPDEYVSMAELRAAGTPRAELELLHEMKSRFHGTIVPFTEAVNKPEPVNVERRPPPADPPAASPKRAAAREAPLPDWLTSPTDEERRQARWARAGVKETGQRPEYFAKVKDAQAHLRERVKHYRDAGFKGGGNPDDGYIFRSQNVDVGIVLERNPLWKGGTGRGDGTGPRGLRV